MTDLKPKNEDEKENSIEEMYSPENNFHLQPNSPNKEDYYSTSTVGAILSKNEYNSLPSVLSDQTNDIKDH